MQHNKRARVTKVPLYNRFLSKWPFQHLSYAYYLSQPHAILIQDLNLAYIPIPKVAHTSIKRVIANIPEHNRVKVHKLHFEQVPLAHLDTDRYFTFGFVRNPLERLISLYERNINEEYPQHLFYRYGRTFRHKMSFEDFLKQVCSIPDSRSDKHFRSQHWFLEREDKIVCQFLGKVEQFQDDWDKLNERFPLGQINKFNESGKKETASYFTPGLLKMAVKRYKRDIELFGYTEEVQEVQKLLST
jgi:hypothetical protein